MSWSPARVLTALAVAGAALTSIVVASPTAKPARRCRQAGPEAVCPIRRGRALGLVISVLAVIGSSLVGLIAAAPAAVAAAQTCSFATPGTGAFASTLCWFDMSGYNAAQATSAAGQQLTIDLPSGYTLTFTIKVTGGAVKASALPTWSGSFLGNSGYTGVAGDPALYQTTSGTTTTATMSAITMTDAGGHAATGYSLIGADAESTDNGEHITWTSSNTISSLGPLGNSCGGGFTGVGTTSVTCTGTSVGNKTGTPILASDAPTTFTQSMTGSGLEGFAFGVLVSRLELNKTVVNGFNTDSFSLSVTNSSAVVVGSASTGPSGASASTGPITVLTNLGGEQYTLAETATAGTLADYTESWSCTRNGVSDPSLPSGAAGKSATVTVHLGDFINCTITNTADAASLLLTKHAATPVDVNHDGLTDAGDTIAYSFTVTNTGDLEIDNIGITDSKAGSVTCPQPSLASGDSEICTADSPYTVTAADVTAGSVHNTATASGTVFGSAATETSPPSSTTTPTTAPAPALRITKSVFPTSVTSAGQTVTYSFVVTNTGNVTLTGVAVNEGVFTGTGTMSTVSCPPGAASMAPGDQVTCTATYSVTQADIDVGSVVNTADASGTDPANATVTSPSSTSTLTAIADPALTIVKSASPSGTPAFHAGDVITYSFVITNTGNLTITDVAVNEGTFTGTGLLSAVSCPAGAGSLAPGDQVTCTATYSVTQADMDAGAVSNTATATGEDPGGGTVTSTPSTATFDATASPALTVTKTASPANPSTAGQTITYSFLMTNTGNVTLTDVTVDEGNFTGTGLMSAVSCPAGAGSLAPGASVTCTATYTLTQADVDTGVISNTATAVADPPTGVPGPAVSPPSTVTTTLPADPELTVDKTVAPTVVTTTGQSVTYSFLITNTGNVTISNAAVSELGFTGSGTLSTVACPPGAASLAPGAQVTCTATYTVTQADLDAGSVSNTADAEGTDPGGDTVISPASTAILSPTANPALTVAKSASSSGGTGLHAGDLITYSFLITNTGNVTISDVTVDEGAFTGTGTLSAATCPAGAASLAPAAQVTCTATYTVTQADVDAGRLSNTATARGTPPPGVPGPTVSPPSTVVITQASAPALTVSKSVSPTSVSTAGQGVTYSFTVTNTGNVTIAGATVSDLSFSGTGTLSAISCPPGIAVLAPAASVTCTATYTVTQADLDAGTVSNTADASGLDPVGDTITSPVSTAVLAVNANPGLAIDKSVSPTSATTAGQVLTYTFVVTNTGNITLNAMTIDEEAFSGTGSMSTVSCPAGAASMAPGAQVTCTATYTLTQADIDAGSVTNTATASANTPPAIPGPVTSGPSTVTMPELASPSLLLAKSVSPNPVTAAGQTVTYTFLVTNTGNVTMKNIDIDESAFSGTGTLSAITCPAGAASLAPGAHVSCTATYTVTQADIDAGVVSNTATASGQDPAGDTVASAPSTAMLSVTADPGLTLVKSASSSGGAEYHVGDVITYSFLVTNTGNVTITDVAIDDSTFSGAGPLSPVTCPPGAASLAPGAQVTCTATYTVVQADVDAGQLSNTATATGTPPAGVPGPTVSPPSVVVIPQAPAPGLTIVKSASPTSVSKVGQTVRYSYLVTNTGNVTIFDVTVDEGHFTGSGSLSAVTCPAGALSLAPGAHVTCTATYVVTQKDIDGNSLSNTATATGTDPAHQTVTSPPSTVSVSIDAVSKLGLHKSGHGVDANHDGLIDAGDRIDWTLVVTNLGATTLTDITISDPSAGTAHCPHTVLAPGESMTCAVPSHTVTAADGTAGRVRNTAIASAQSGQNVRVTSARAQAVVDVHATPGGPPLPFTGFGDTGPLVKGGIALIGLGAVLLFGSMVRRRSDGPGPATQD